MISSPIASAFVGRVAELRFLSDRLADASDGRGSVTIVSGEAGIGKSRLITEFRRAVTTTRALVGVGRCIEYLQAPYAPWFAVFDALFGAERDPIRASFDDDPDRKATLKRRAFRDAAQAFATRSRSAALVLIIEDAHWADAGTLELTDYLAKTIANHRLMIVLTHRDTIGADDEAAATALARLARAGAHAVKLDRLSRDDMFELVSTAPRRTGLRTHDIERIVELSDGNPLFGEQLLRDAIEGGPEGDAGGTLIPSTLHDLISDRVRLLEPDARHVLLLASAIGRRFDPRLLAAASPYGADFTASVLERACALQLLAIKSPAPLTYGFYHALVREAVYREIPPAELPAIHAAIARAWERLGPNAGTFPDVAYQWAAAGEFTKADSYYTLAGDAAVDLYAYADAQRFYERALGFAHADPLRCAALRARIAGVQYTTGALGEALVSLHQAHDGYRSEPASPEAAQLLERIAFVQAQNGDTRAALRAAERAIETMGPVVRPEALAGLVVTAAGLMLSTGDAVGAEEYLARWNVAEPAEPAVVTALLNVRGRLHAARGNYDGAAADFEAAARIGRTNENGDAVIAVLTDAADVRALRGASQAAVDLWSEAYALARERHLGWRIPFCAFGCAGVLHSRGEVSRALEYVEAALRFDLGCPAVGVRAAEVGIPLGMLLERTDIVERCDDADIVERVFRSGDTARVAALAGAYIPLLFERDQPGAARELLARAAAVLRTGDESPLLYLLVARHGARGIAVPARAALESAAQRSSEHVAHAFLPLFDAIAKRRLRRVRGAKERASIAAARFERLGLRYWNAVALEAAGHERQAAAHYTSMGATGEARRLARHLASGTVVHVAQLTPREEQVAVLVREGMTNRQISEAFGISEHTVESHLKSIFNRLGIRSRWQITDR